MFRFTRNGRPQSTAVLISFACSLLFLAVYMAAFLLLVVPVHRLFTAGPKWLSAAAEALLPALAGTAVCSLPVFFVREKRYVPLAYLWLTGYALFLLAAMLFLLRSDRSALLLFLRFYLLTVPCPLLTGAVLTGYLFRRSERTGSSGEEAVRQKGKHNL